MTNNLHASDDDLVGYLYRTLSDAERETLDAHFIDCPDCRTRLTTHEVQKRQIDQGLKAAIRQVSPSDQMTFDAIAPLLPNRRPFLGGWLRMDTATPVFITVVGLCLALIGLWQGFSSFLSAAELHAPGAMPTVAGFAFVFVSVGQLERALVARPRFVIVAILTGLLWLGAAILGLISLLVIRDLSLWVFVSSGSSNAWAGAVTILVMMISALIYITAVIGGAEYHYKQIGQPSSWKLFAWTIGIELLILILPHFVF